MGGKATAHMKDSNLVFLGAGGSQERDRVAHIFN